MNEIPVDPQIWKLAQAILTPKQLVVLELREKHGYSWNQICIATNCARPTAKEHHRAATRNLLNTIELAGGIEQALARAHAKQQLDWMTEMERTELEVFPDARPRGDVIVQLEQEATAEKEGHPPTDQPRPTPDPNTSRTPTPHPRRTHNPEALQDA